MINGSHRSTHRIASIALLFGLTLLSCDASDPLAPDYPDGEGWSIPCGAITTDAELDYFGRRTNLNIRFFVGAEDSMVVDWSGVRFLYQGDELDVSVTYGLDGATTLAGADDTSLIVTDTTVIRFHAVIPGEGTSALADGEDTVRFHPDGFIACDGAAVALDPIGFTGVDD